MSSKAVSFHLVIQNGSHVTCMDFYSTKQLRSDMPHFSATAEVNMGFNSITLGGTQALCVETTRAPLNLN